MSTPISRANRRTEGAAGTRWPGSDSSGSGAATAGAAAVTGAATSTGSAAAAGAAGSAGGTEATGSVPSCAAPACSAGAAAAGAAGSGRSSTLRRCQREHELPGRHLVAFLYVNLLYYAGHRRRHFDRGLVRLHLDDRIAFGDGVSDGHNHLDDRRGIHTLLQNGKFKLESHRVDPPAEGSSFGLRRLRPGAAPRRRPPGIPNPPLHG